LYFDLLCRGFKLYLNGKPDYDFLQYRQHVHEITQKFIELSQNIREIEATLKNSDRGQLAGIIRKIQLKEKEKLDLVCDGKAINLIHSSLIY